MFWRMLSVLDQGLSEFEVRILEEMEVIFKRSQNKLMIENNYKHMGGPKHTHGQNLRKSIKR